MKNVRVPAIPMSALEELLGPEPKKFSSEQVFHKATASFLHRALKAPTVWTTIPVGGGGKVRGAHLKAMGLHRGWPDIIIIHPHEDSEIYSKVCGLELKAEKGSLSADQKVFKLVFEKANGWYAMCKTLEDVQDALDAFNIPLHARLS